MHYDEFLHYQIDMLGRLPYIEAIGLGGSSGLGKGDVHSDLDFFLLIADAEFFRAVKMFPEQLSHPWPILATRRRGFVPDFGFQVCTVYANLRSVDYHLNCPSSLRRTPMARKTRIIMDKTGRFSDFHRDLPASAMLTRAQYADDACAEVLIELLKIQKYVRRQELVSTLHRFERLRLVLMGLERFLRHGEPYSPHDADKWVNRDLSPTILAEVTVTFCPQDWLSAADAFQSLVDSVLQRVDTLGSASDEFWRAVRVLTIEVVELMRRNPFVAELKADVPYRSE